MLNYYYFTFALFIWHLFAMKHSARSSFGLLFRACSLLTWEIAVSVGNDFEVLIIISY